MNIVIACDSFKESLTSLEVESAIEKGFKKVFPRANYTKIPLADGGEGTTHALVHATNGKIIECSVLNPLKKTVNAYYGILPNQTAVIEMAVASGLELLTQSQKNPLETSSYGFGELIAHALDQNITHFVLGLGGSATNDAGVGMLQALGVKFLDKNKKEIGWGAKNIHKIISIDITGMHPKLKNATFDVACDVTNPLCGQNGASTIFGPQKGATPEMIEFLDTSLLTFALLCEKSFKKETKMIEGAGAAGGLGFGLITFLNAQLKKGIDLISSVVNLEEKIKIATVVITGEGRMDGQTIYGKTPIGVSRIAQKYGIPVIAIVGSVSEGYEAVYEHGIDAVFDCVPCVTSLENVLSHASVNLETTSYNVAQVLSLNNRRKNKCQ